MTTITIKDQYGEYTVTHYKDDIDIYEMMDFLVKPVIVASGYSEKTVEAYFS